MAWEHNCPPEGAFAHSGQPSLHHLQALYNPPTSTVVRFKPRDHCSNSGAGLGGSGGTVGSTAPRFSRGSLPLYTPNGQDGPQGFARLSSPSLAVDVPLAIPLAISFNKISCAHLQHGPLLHCSSASGGSTTSPAGTLPSHSSSRLREAASPGKGPAASQSLGVVMPLTFSEADLAMRQV